MKSVVERRPYDLGKRAVTAACSRGQIIRAARHLVSDGDTDVSLDAIAHEAGVSRPTIYRHFGSRPDLIRALIAEAAETAKLRPNVDKALSVAAPRAAVTAFVVASARVWESETRLVRALVRISADPDFATVIAEAETSRLRDVLVVASKTRRSRADVKRIASGLMMLTGPQAYLYLVDSMHVSAAAARSLLVQMAVGLLDGGDTGGDTDGK